MRSDSARLYAIVARRARTAVVFRRGPSKQVRLLTWNLENDEIVGGQWFRHRIYERRSDLTPGGKGLVYLATSYRRSYYSWTAISRPPFLTAVTLWPGLGTWGGGGLFETENRLLLNDGPSAAPDGMGEVSFLIGEGFRLPPDFSVAPLGEHSRDEDHPIESLRLTRDGWRFVNERIITRWGRDPHVVFDPPWTRTKRLPCIPARALRVQLHGLGEFQGRQYIETADVVDGEGQPVLDLGRIDWADLDHNGDVLFAKDGRLFRLPVAASTPSLVADLNPMRFEPIEPPEWARSWW